MFEVIEIGVPEKRGFFRRKRIPVKMRATTAMHCEMLGRTFQGHGKCTIQTYHVDFNEGDVITLRFPKTEVVSVGDRRSIESLSGQGYLKNYFRMVSTTH